VRVLITGGAGCLGSNIAEALCRQGVELCVIDNFATSRRQLVEQVPGVLVVEGSVADAALVAKTFADFRPSHVIHSAASYKDPMDWTGDAQTNVLGSINVADASAAVGVRQVINFQTTLCYGRPRSVPIPVDHPLDPVGSYGISKTAGESYLLQSEVPVVSLRIANVCGPRLSIGPIPTFYKRLKSGLPCFCTRSVRDFLDMQDFLDLLATVLQLEQAHTGCFNVSSGEGHSIAEVFREVATYLGTPEVAVDEVDPGEDDVPVVVLDPSQTEARLGWKARVSFAETIARQLAWYDAHGVEAIYSHLKPVPAQREA